jgi:hypothetical protein
MDPRLVGTEATRKWGEACDLILIAVEPGRVDAWEEAARLWATSRYRASVSVRNSNTLAVLMQRTNPHQAVNSEAVLTGITEQFRRNTTNPDPPKRARV